MSTHVHDLERDLSSGIAMAMAMKSPSVPSGRSGIVSFSTGFYNDEQAIAFSRDVKNENKNDCFLLFWFT